MNNDLISRSALLADAEKLSSSMSPSDEEIGARKVIHAIVSTPAVDAVEVVRCKDCIHYEKTMLYSECWHALGMINVYDDCYCSRGERRSNGT